MKEKLKIAIIHDALCVKGGAEKFILSLAKAFPDAPIYTSVYLPNETFEEFKELNVIPLKSSHWVKSDQQFKQTYPLWLLKTRLMDFSDYDLVISSSTYLAKYIKPHKTTLHLAYIHAPFRYVWKTKTYTPDSLPFNRNFTPFVRLFLPAFRMWDRSVTRKIKNILTISRNMQAEILNVYGRSVSFIYPPIVVDDFQFSDKDEGYYLIVSRLVSHKRNDIAVEAFNQLGKRLIVVGEGPQREYLEKTANDNIEFLGKVPFDQLRSLYANAKALVFTSHEDFGLVPIEAQASGKPVLAFNQGGALETVIPGKTGLFYEEQTAEAVIDCVQRFEQTTFDHAVIREWSRSFDESQFIQNIQEYVDNLLATTTH